MGPFLFHDEMLSGPIIYKYYIGNQNYYESTSSEYIMTGKYIFFQHSSPNAVSYIDCFYLLFHLVIRSLKEMKW